MTNKFIYFR